MGLFDSLRNVRPLQNRSLKFKITLSVAVLVLTVATIRTILTVGALEQVVHRLIIDRQEALARSIADDLDQKLGIAQKALVAAASQVSPATLAAPQQGRLFLLAKRPLHSIFNDRLQLIDAGGKLVAQPPSPTVSADPGSLYYFQKTMLSGQPVISTLTEGRPVVMLTAPVRDGGGRLIGVLAGGVALTGTNVLGDLPRMRIGAKGYACLHTLDGTVIAHRNPKRLLKPPPSAARGLFDRSLAGREVSAETVNAEGVPMLTTYHRLHATDWVLGINSPTDEAYAVIRELEPKLIGGIVGGTALLLALVWLTMQWLTRPLRRLTREVEAMGEGTELKPVECRGSSYEISTLAQAFNQLVETVHRQQSALQQNERKYRIVADNAYDWQFWLSPEGCFIYSSPSGKQITGYEATDFLNDPDLLERIVHPDDRGVFRECRDWMLQRKRVQEREWRIVRSDGTIRWISHRWQPIFGDDGEYLGLRGNNRDITEQREMEAALQQSEQRYRTLVECSPDAVLLHRDGTIIYANPAACRLFGAEEPGELLGMPVIFRAHPDYREEVAGRIRNAELGIANPFREQVVLRLDGSAVEVEAIVAQLSYQGSTVIQAVLRDISCRKQAERALRQGEETIRNLMEILPVGVMLAAEDGVIEYLNRSFVESFGYQPEELLTMDEWHKRAYPDPAYRERIVSERDAAFAQANDGQVLPIEADVTCRDGAQRHMIVNIQLCGNRMIAIFTDITERELLQSELLKAQKLESLGVLAGGIAHDFNNILTGILGNISLARMFLDESHKSFLLLNHAEKASLRAAELAKQLLTFAKGGAPIKKTMALAPLAAEAVSLALHGTNVKGVVRLSEDLPAVAADEGQLSQAFHNIILNAVQAMPEGGALTVSADSLSLRPGNSEGLPPGRYLMLSFADEGHGMPSELQQKIFDPYFTTKRTGTGLGLASVHSTISKHDGKIKVSSAPGKGTIFTLLIPAVAEAVEPCRAEGPRAEEAPMAKGKGEPVLVMDDEPLILDFARELLEHQGYRVTTCSSGERAIELHRERREAGDPFAAAIMDLTVPGGMGGEEAARRILAEDPGARLIVSSGYSSDPVLAHYRSHGFLAAVAKPYKGCELARVLAALEG